MSKICRQVSVMYIEATIAQKALEDRSRTEKFIEWKAGQ